MTDENDGNDEATAELGAFDNDEEPATKLGDVLSGRLKDIDIDSVKAVRETRERR